MRIALAQTQFALGDFDQNCGRVLEILKKSEKGGADLLAFPEGGLWGYPPKDFLFHSTHFNRQAQKLSVIKARLKKGMGLILPAFIRLKGRTLNGALLMEKGKKTRFFAKEFLPDQGVFFESRYFGKGRAEDNFFLWKGKKIQLLICEDLWRARLKEPADFIIALNSSPYTDKKQISRLKKMRGLARPFGCPALYLNRAGAQDSLIFDGASFALNAKGKLVWQGEFFKPDFKILDFSKTLKLIQKARPGLQEQREKALVLGIREFFSQTGFSQAILGLSGGIDSALTAGLAAQALGEKAVEAYFLPGPHTLALSQKIARETAKRLNIRLREKDISPLFKELKKSLFKNKLSPRSPALQNIQSRLRMLILMAEANREGRLLLSTGNKSEMAMGYSTLYGDLSGALCPLGDLFKTQVYELARFINQKSSVFPKELFSREPSAELAPGQKDKDDLPPYSQLDPLLEKILRGGRLKGAEEKKLAQRAQAQEFKRAQAPPILKLSEQDLGESWRRPIAHKFPV